MPDPVTLLRRHLGYPGFRPGQEELVRTVLEGRDALGVLPTGGGKSVCYQIPALALGGVTVVVTPLVSLMEDQVGRARAAGLRADHLSATQSGAKRRSVMEQARAGSLDILFVAPERLELAAFRTFLRSVDVRLLAVDEAHCISEWGHDFRPAYRRIDAARSLLRCPTLALTATATPAVREDIVANLRLDDPLVLVRSFDRPNLSWSVRPGGRPSERVARVHALLRERRGCAIVYGPTRRSVESTRDRLAARGMRAEAYHAGLPGEERTRVQETFMRGACRVVVATNAFGMGIDKPDVRTVVHVQLPTTLEAYYQEAGRAGRDGEPADCVALHARGDRRLGRSFIDRTHPSVRALRSLHRFLLKEADSEGRVDLESPVLVRRLGDDLEAWRTGDPVGALGALERLGVVRRLLAMGSEEGTREALGGSLRLRALGVRRALPVSEAVRSRRRALLKEAPTPALSQPELIVNVRTAKNQLSSLLDQAAQGNEVIITSDGLPKAKLVPIRSPRRSFRTNWDLLRSTPTGINQTPSSEDLIRKDRDERG